MRSILQKSFKKHFLWFYFVMLNFSLISTEVENLSFVWLILSAMLTFQHKKKATLHFTKELQNKNAISVNSFPLLKNNEKIC